MDLEFESIMRKFDLHPMSCPDTSLFDLLPSNIYASDDIKWFNHSSGFNVLQVNKGFHGQLVSVLPQLMEGFKFKYDLVLFSLTHHFDNLEQQAVRLCDKNLFIINNTPAALPGVLPIFSRSYSEPSTLSTVLPPQDLPKNQILLSTRRPRNLPGMIFIKERF